MISFTCTLYKLQKRNHAAKERIERIQQRGFRALLRHAVSRSEFYRSLYQGIKSEDCRLTDLPVVTKAAMMADYDRFVTDRRLKLNEIRQWLRGKNDDGKLYLGKYIPILTSGSSGENALVVYDRRAMNHVQAAFFARHANQDLPRGISLRWLAKLCIGRRLRVAFVLVPDGNIHAIAKYPPAMHQFISQQRVFSLFDPIEQTVEELNEYRPDVLFCYSSFFDLLASEQVRGRLNIRFQTPLSFLAGGSEPLTDRTQQLALNAWNVDAQNHYGTTECFVMARSCHRSRNLHVMNDLCILEIVDRHNNPVPAGQVGEKVLLTNLFNYVQPFIRYEIEDVTGFLMDDCNCGLPFPTIRPISGRATDVLYVDHGRGGYTALHPYRLIDVLRRFNEIRQYQVVQTARNELTCLYVPEDSEVNLAKQVQKAMVAALEQESLHECVAVKVQAVTQIPRQPESGKFKSVISVVGPPEDRNR